MNKRGGVGDSWVVMLCEVVPSPSQEMPTSCTGTVCSKSLLSACLLLLQLTQAHVQASAAAGQGSTGQGEPPHAPKWLSPLLLMLDVWEKTLMVYEWTRPSNKVCGCALVEVHSQSSHGFAPHRMSVTWCGSGLTTPGGAPTQLICVM